MGSSLVLQGGAASAKSLREIITQNHTFTKGTVVRWDTNTNTYVRAQADSAANAEVAGIVSDVPGTTAFEITYKGVIDGIVVGPAGVSAPVMFLSSTVAGGLETSPPSAVGTVVKPVLTRNTSGTGYLVMNYLGTQIGGSSTIAVDEIQPVGTVMPFAGSAIPDTWLECNGASYAIGDYPQLYDRVRYTSGVRAPMYGHVFTATTSAVGYRTTMGGNPQSSFSTLQNAVNGTTPVYLRTASAVQTQDIVARILSVSGSDQIITITAQVIPTYNQSTKNFSTPNSFVKIGGLLNDTVNPSGIRGIGYMGSDGIVGIEIASGAVVSTLSITHFNVPDLRGRFALGINSGNIADIDGDSVFNSAIGTYGIASLGGEESHTLSMSEMASHSHDIGTISLGLSGSHRHYFVTDDNGGGRAEVRNYGVNQLASFGFGGAEGGGTLYLYETNEAGAHRHTISGSVAATGTNSPHNNMPPYLAVRYIIKAKPYTRAAIIDGVDIPYNTLLIRDLRTRAVYPDGGNTDLVFHVNSSSDTSGTGLERMRFSHNIGGPSVIFTSSGDDESVTDVRIRENSGDQFIDFHASVGQGGWNPLNLLSGQSIIFGSSNNGANATGLTLTIAPWSNSAHGLVLTSNGRLGINTNTPAVALDVNGLARSNVAVTAITDNKHLATKEYVDSKQFSGVWTTFEVQNGTWIQNLDGKTIWIRAVVNRQASSASFPYQSVYGDVASTSNPTTWIRADHNEGPLNSIRGTTVSVGFFVPAGYWYRIVHEGNPGASSVWGYKFA